MVFYKGGGGSFALLKQLKNKVTIGGNLSKGFENLRAADQRRTEQGNKEQNRLPAKTQKRSKNKTALLHRTESQKR